VHSISSVPFFVCARSVFHGRFIPPGPVKQSIRRHLEQSESLFTVGIHQGGGEHVVTLGAIESGRWLHKDTNCLGVRAFVDFDEIIRSYGPNYVYTDGILYTRDED